MFVKIDEEPFLILIQQLHSGMCEENVDEVCFLAAMNICTLFFGLLPS